ncbi:hypothetical protein SUGI_0517760 [Cryptomeria japonica]|nr:hypothetical protein SUGI_0517760 [Cryptomeria japonica]
MAGRLKKSSEVGVNGGALQLHGAARSGDLEAFQTLYASNPTLTVSLINSRDNHSRTPLHLAAWSGQTKVVQFLCEHKADVRAAAVDDMAAIHFASQKGHLEIVRILLRSGASVNAYTRKGMTALHCAVQGGHLELVKFLIQKGANVSAETKARKKPIDLAKDDQVRSVLTTSGELLKGHRGTQINKPHGASASNDTEGKQNNPLIEMEEISGVAKEDGDIEKGGHREREEEETKALIGPQPKKAKVALSHLVDDETLLEDG